MAGGSGVKTNEREGTRAQARYIRISAYKVREVIDLIRGQHVQRAAEILRFTERDAAHVVAKVLGSAVANAENNDGLDPDDLYVATAYADEGVTLKRFRPRARGRAGRIRKRTCHVTIIVSRMPEDELRRHRAKQQAEVAARRARRVAGGRAGGGAPQGGGEERGGRFRRNRGKGGEQAAASTDETVTDEVTEDQIDDQIEAEESFEDVETAEVAEAVEASEEPAVEADQPEAPEADAVEEEGK